MYYMYREREGERDIIMIVIITCRSLLIICSPSIFIISVIVGICFTCVCCNVSATLGHAQKGPFGKAPFVFAPPPPPWGAPWGQSERKSTKGTRAEGPFCACPKLM